MGCLSRRQEAHRAARTKPDEAYRKRSTLLTLTGDVIDVGFFYTRMMALRNWIGGDQATGRIVQFGNSKIFGDTPVYNYTRNFFDNCWEYYNGETENILGRGLKGRVSVIGLGGYHLGYPVFPGRSQPHRSRGH